ncbi:MAG: hypothetical protein HOH14_03560 [Gammaproteobacteria bacterium]|nr:hypothetical protein [Gammaproteobacteria bacterium]MBT6042552.1 hypothetical protein [Gammaproteobacteria bacterium]
MAVIETLIGEIEAFCKQQRISKSTFGLRVVNDGKLVNRLKDGKGVTLKTITRIQDYLGKNQNSQNNEPDDNNESDTGGIMAAAKPKKASPKINAKKAAPATKAKTKQIKKKDKNAEPFRFYDNRQNYLAFINTCNEKSAISKRISKEFQYIHPSPPAFRMFDAGMGDATVLSNCMRDLHHRFPTVPHFIVAKEISMEDVRIGLDKMVDRFSEHPATILVLTNLNYAEAPKLMPSDVATANAMNWQEIRLEGTNSYNYKEQLESMHDMFADGWATQTSKVSGNPVFKRPSVVVIYREDHKILLDSVIPKPGLQQWEYDFILASQPWRAKTSAKFKAEKIVAPLAKALAPGGRLLAIQSCGKDPAFEVIKEFWPDSNPFPVSRHDILREVRRVLGREARNYNIKEMSDSRSIFEYRMHALPSEIGGANIGTSTLFAAWNASVYVNQIEDELVEQVIEDGNYLKVTSKILNKYGGLWFNDETFVVSRTKS